MLSLAKRVREAVTPARRTSGFLTKGVLTPEEFIAAGDQLVFKCPTWSWEGGDPDKQKGCLPDKNKQFLVTRNVPCHRRAKALEGEYLGDTEVVIGRDEGDRGTCGELDVEDVWVNPNVVSEPTRAEWERAPGDSDEVEELQLSGQGEAGAECQGLAAISLVESHFTVPSRSAVQSTRSTPGMLEGECHGGASTPGRDSVGVEVKGSGDQSMEIEDCPDLDSYVEDNLLQGDEATVQAGSAYLTAQEPEDSILPTRTYDLSITYDKHYQTPRIWLFGYNESGQPLIPEEVFEDVMQDYARQTVTMELHPHLSSHHASVHPCKHADTMKIMLDNLTRGDKEARVDQYLFIFLKFIQSVVPTIDYDYTMAVDACGGNSSANAAEDIVGPAAKPA